MPEIDASLYLQLWFEALLLRIAVSRDALIEQIQQALRARAPIALWGLLDYTMRIGQGLLHHNRHMLTFAGKTPTNSRAASVAASRRVRRGTSSAPVAISTTPEA